MSDTSQGVSVGDAVLSFIGDTQNLDQSIDSVGAKVEAGMARAGVATDGFSQKLDEAGEEANVAGDAVEEGMERATGSIREARGEAMLLGEAIGVRLPRHVTSFIATIPGVGEALSAAFSATAVLFILEAVVKLTEKVSDFISTSYIYTQAMKDSEAATAAMNTEILRHLASMKELQKAYDEVGMTAEGKLKKDFADLTDEIGKQQSALDKLKASSVSAAQAQGGMWDTVKNTALQAVDFVAGTHLLENKLLGEAVDANEKAENAKALAVKQAQDKIDEERLKSAALAKQLAIDTAKKAGDEAYKVWTDWHNINEMIEDDTARLAKAVEAQYADMSKSMTAMGTTPENSPFVKTLLAGKDAASQLGIVLKSDLIRQLNDTVTAYNALEKSGLATDNQLKEIQKTIESMSKAIDNFDQKTPQVNEFFKAFSQGGKQSEAAMWGFADAYGQGMQKVISGEEGLGQAMEAATKAFIGQIGARALVQGMFYLAQGIADSVWNPGKAAADFAASAEFLAIGGAASAAAGAMGGGASGASGGSGSMGSQPHGAIQTTGSTSQGTVTSTNVQKFAAGGLVSQPTLAMIGDAIGGGSANEGVLPLDNPDAMRQIAGAIAEHLGMSQSASGHTFNMRGHFSKREMKEIVKKISQGVQHGTMSVHSSSTGRITRRSP
jgi:hypothetical protein